MKIEGKFIFKVAGTLTAISLVVALLLGLTNNKYIILLIMNVILLVSGTFMDVTAAVSSACTATCGASLRPTASSPRWRRSRRP